MGTSNLRQFGILLWKNWLLQKRQIILTVVQVLLPALFALVLLLIRTRVQAEFIQTPTVWNSFSANTTLPPNLVLPLRYPTRRWQVAFAPNVSVVQKLVTAAVYQLDNATRTQNTGMFTTGVAIGQGFASESELENFFTSQNSATTLCGLVFTADSFDSSGGLLRSNAPIVYKIRLRAEGYNGTFVQGAQAADAWQTSRVYAKQLKPQPQGDMYGGNAASSEQFYIP